MQAIISTISSWIKAVIAFITRIFEWLGGLFKDFMEFVTDLPVKILHGFLDGVIYLLNMIPVPDFIAQYSLQSLFNALPDSVLWFIQFFGIPQAFAIFGLGVAARLTRKAMTLGQW